jgi:hypothetical protein
MKLLGITRSYAKQCQGCLRASCRALIATGQTVSWYAMRTRIVLFCAQSMYFLLQQHALSLVLAVLQACLGSMISMILMSGCCGHRVRRSIDVDAPARTR